MTIDEGGVSKGSLSDFVLDKLKGIADRKAETEKQTANSYFQRTALLRDYLIALAAPMEALFASFRVRELLEEARSLVGSRLMGPIYEWIPQYYRDIVLKPDPSKVSLMYGMKKISLDDLKDLEDFQNSIPRLNGFGFTLDAKGNDCKLPVTETLIFYEQRINLGYVTFDINGISSSSPTEFYIHEERIDFPRMVNSRVGNHMTITAVEPEGKDALATEYDLEYRVDRSVEEIFSFFPEIARDITIALGLKTLGLEDKGKFVGLANRDPINRSVVPKFVPKKYWGGVRESNPLKLPPQGNA